MRHHPGVAHGDGDLADPPPARSDWADRLAPKDDPKGDRPDDFAGDEDIVRMGFIDGFHFFRRA